MRKKIILGILIATVILFSTGAYLYANPNDHPKQNKHKYLNTSEDLSGKNNKNLININSNNYNISILAPLGIEDQKTFKKNSTIPVKFILTDNNSNIVKDLSIKLYLAKIENNTAGSIIKATSPGKSNNDNYFKFNKSSKKYAFNLSTKNLSPGTWRLIVDLGNGTIFNIDIILN